MKVEDQVCSLELAKKLFRLGFKHKFPPSIFVWEYINDDCYTVKYVPYAVVPSYYNNVTWMPAFTVAELGNLLPPSTQPLTYWISKISTSCENSLWQSDIIFNRKSLSIFWDKTEANVRAKMLIFLIENGHIKTD